MSEPVYNQIGNNYSIYRKADARIVQKILELLNVPENSVIAEIGAGTGNYSFAIAEKGYRIKAIEPSDVMLNQKKEHPDIEWVKGRAEEIPLDNCSVDAVIGILSVHHFSDLNIAFEEMNRITNDGTILLFTYDPRQIESWWLADYFPFLWNDSFKFFPPIEHMAEIISSKTNSPISTHVFELPNDLADYFAAAGWNRPEIYIDPVIRSCMSAFAIADQSVVNKGLKALEDDLNSGNWDSRYGWLRAQRKIDLGYRFVLSRSAC